jgi:hypothetical protein
MAREPIASIMDKVPSQLDQSELQAEIDIEMPEAINDDMLEASPEVEVTLEDDGGVVVDFDPNVGEPEGEFGENLAEAAIGHRTW